jgi:hypothetical protein
VLDWIEEGGKNAYWHLRMNSKQFKSKWVREHNICWIGKSRF